MKKIKKVNSSIISIQNGLKEAEKERKKFQSRIPFILHPKKKIAKKIAKKFKKLKNLFLALFIAKNGEIGRESEKKNLFPNSVHNRTEQEISKEIKKN